MQERKRSWSVVWAWIPCRVQSSLYDPVALEWAATASSAMAASTGCTRNAVGSSTWQRILIIDVHGAKKLYTPWTGDNIGKSKSKLTSWRWKLPFATEEICSQQPVAANFQPQHVWKLPGRSLRSCYQFSFPTTSLSGHVVMCTACVQWAMLHASETWWLTKPDLQHLQQNDTAMIRQICSVKPQDIVTTRFNELLAWLGIEDLDIILKKRLRWYGHVECSNGAVKRAFDIQVDGKRGPGRPKMT